MSALRELKILAFVVVVVGILYWGVEPLAHSVFYPKTAPADFAFSDLEKLPTTGNIENGKVLVNTYCIACHNIEKEGVVNNDVAPSDLIAAYGVLPPDLSNIGAIYESNFLANLIKKPTKTLKMTHKFENEKNPMPFPMTPAPVSDAEIGDMVAYFVSIGDKNLASSVENNKEYTTKLDAINKSDISEENKKKQALALKSHIENKEIFISACTRCHSMKYDNITSSTPSKDIQNYLGAKAPDLSMMIRSKGEKTLSKFINDPQKTLENAAMPRVGLNEYSQEKVIKYLESIGDSKKEQRIFVGKILIGFMIIMSIFAYLWKRKIWRDLH